MAFIVNVPDVAGVPPVAFAGVTIAPVLLTQDGYNPSLFAEQWGLFLGGAVVVAADSVIDMTYRQDWSVCDFPVEKGAFASYNKVQIPYDVRLRFSAGGSLANREQFLASITAIVGDTNLYDAVTPEVVYHNLNIKHYDYRRTAVSGVGLLTVDVWAQEVRIAQQTNYPSVASASGAPQVNGGTVQATTPSTVQSETIST
jgi:hypothetical protein